MGYELEAIKRAIKDSGFEWLGTEDLKDFAGYACMYLAEAMEKEEPYATSSINSLKESYTILSAIEVPIE